MMRGSTAQQQHRHGIKGEPLRETIPKYKNISNFLEEQIEKAKTGLWKKQGAEK